jgi:hypothetical protein
MKKIKDFLKNYNWILVFTGLGILFDIFIFNPTWDLVILFLTALWVLSVWLYKFEGRVSISGGLFFLILCPLLLIFGKESMAEKSAIWAYMFLVVGVVQLFVEYLKEERKGAKIKKK